MQLLDSIMNAVRRKLVVTTLILALVTVSGLTIFFSTMAQAQSNIQKEFLVLVNSERASLGKAPLVANSQLENAAYLHSKDMGDNDYFSHTSLDGRTFSQRITAAGYNYVAAAENIAMASGGPSASTVYDMWKNSSGHYANMIGNYAEAGLGVYSVNGKTYYTLDLGKSNSSPTPTTTPIIPEIALFAILIAMILLPSLAFAMKLKNNKKPVNYQ
jgi:uncharacterized protein YkwD